MARCPAFEVELHNWPLRDDGQGAWLLALAVPAASLATGYFSSSFPAGVLALLACVAATWRLWIPVTIQVGPTGIRQRIGRWESRIRWRDVRRYEICRRGVLILPASESGPLAAARGLYIRWNGRREELLEVVRYYARPHADRRPDSTLDLSNR